MRILITGAAGFVGKNLAATLDNIRTGKDRTRGDFQVDEVYLFDRDDTLAQLSEYCRQAEVIVHLAGVNRPKETDEFTQGNVDFTTVLLDTLRRQDNRCPVLLSSSIQAAQDNPYGVSKRAAEDLVLAYGEQQGVPVWVYRLPNLFGKWCRPFYNSVVATFCHQLARGEAITVNSRATVLTMAYIDDVIDDWIDVLAGHARREAPYYTVPVTHTVTLGDIADKLTAFAACRQTLAVPDLGDPFTRKLYATYLSYLPPAACAYDLTTHSDARGSFAEMLRTPDRGQLSVNVTKPGQVKGNHWHHTKHEKFLVVAGEGVIRQRPVAPDADADGGVITCRVSGDRLQVVDILPGYTHNIENVGTTDLVTLMWASECFDPQRPDTYFLEI